jgi:thymidylate synthase
MEERKITNISQLKPFHINAKTISDAWFQLIFNIFDNSYFQKIQKGSFENEQYRLQYPGASVFIEYPHSDMVPVMPPGQESFVPTSEQYIEDYFIKYLAGSELEENETYTYGSRINHPMPGNEKMNILKKGTQLERVIEMLSKTPLTNQAVVEIATPEDIDVCYGKDGKLDPPCLRLLDFKAVPVNDELFLTVSAYFRSWDLWAGFPTNLGGIELLKQLVASETNLKNGPMFAYSAGLHIYGYQEEFARIRTLKTIKNNLGVE